jgi:DNA repair exonuclease SbcCD nuclease subunit
MNNLSIKRILIFSMVLILATVVCDSQSFDRPNAPRQQRSVSKKPIKQKKDKITGSRSVKKVQKKQSAKEKKLDKDYEKYVKENRERAIEIQTPEVKERMKQNFRDADARYKAKKKKTVSSTRKAEKKYR